MRSSRSFLTRFSGSLAVGFGVSAALLALGADAPAQGLSTRDMATGGVTATGLVEALVGTGASISSVQFRGAPIAAGTFTNGTGSVGLAQGIILGTGNIAAVAGPANLSDSTSNILYLPGDSDLDVILGGPTYDASVLEFDLESTGTGVISFQFVFASEEYDEFINIINDGFACLLNGQNIALVPGSQPPTPISIGTINCGNPYNPLGGSNCGLYITNDCKSLGLGYPCQGLGTEMDGLTTVLSASGTLVPGVNHVKFAIADQADPDVDSNVFILCPYIPPAFDPPTPSGQTLLATAGMPLQFTVDGLAMNGLPGQSVVLTVSGSPGPLAAGVFLPALPLGPAAHVETNFAWTPQPGDVGPHQLQFMLTDQLGLISQCVVGIDVEPPLSATFCYGDGTGTPCPCNNNGAVGHGCANLIVPSGGLLLATGSASLSNDTLVLTGSSMPNTTSVYVQGTQKDTGGLGTQLGDGLRCITGGMIRLGAVRNAAGGSQYPSAGFPPISLRGQIPVAGGTRYYQVWYRTPNPAFCTGARYNLTNGYAQTWTP